MALGAFNGFATVFSLRPKTFSGLINLGAQTDIGVTQFF